jgi:hypothetical protein
MDMLNVRAPGRAKRRGELVMRKQLAAHYALIQDAVVNQYARCAFDPDLQRLALESQNRYDIVERNQSSRRHESSKHGVVAAIHGILDCIAKHQEKDQIKGRQLSRVSFARNPQDDEQEDVHNRGTYDKFPPRQAQVPHSVIPCMNEMVRIGYGRRMGLNACRVRVNSGYPSNVIVASRSARAK